MLLFYFLTTLFILFSVASKITLPPEARDLLNKSLSAIDVNYNVGWIKTEVVPWLQESNVKLHVFQSSTAYALTHPSLLKFTLQNNMGS
jgi:hypothetical protein